MTEAATLKPLKTWSHLAKQRRRPSEYEIVSTNLFWHTRDQQAPWDVDSGFMSDWYMKHRNNSPLKHEDWDVFRDPDETVYRTYNIVQDGQEAYVDGLLEEYAGQEHDEGLPDAWLTALAELYTPGRYVLHAVQMASAYLVHMAPASTIANCAIFQAADALRWVSRTAYRTRELANAHGAKGFAANERQHWETLPAWQGFRELMEKLLVAYDWGETFVALNVVAKPAIDEACLRQFAACARRHQDTLFALLADAQLRDSERSRRWTAALMRMIAANPANKPVVDAWLQKWIPLGDQAITAFCAALPESPGAASEAIAAAKAFRATLQ